MGRFLCLTVPEGGRRAMPRRTVGEAPGLGQTEEARS